MTEHIELGVAIAAALGSLVFGFHYWALRDELRELRAYREAMGRQVCRNIAAVVLAQDDERRAAGMAPQLRLRESSEWLAKYEEEARAGGSVADAARRRESR